MKDRFFKQAGHEYSERQRLVAMLPLAFLFLLILPFALIALGSKIDQWLGWPHLVFQPLNLILGCLLIISGWLFGLWSVYTQLTIGRGTPVPLMATQKLVIQPPYQYCRNPMALGSFVMYGGVAILTGSLGAVLLVVLGIASLLTYIKRVEEKEMEIRFGEEYLAYKRRTPFLIPRLK